jgi:hypothetical protein
MNRQNRRISHGVLRGLLKPFARMAALGYDAARLKALPSRLSA